MLEPRAVLARPRALGIRLLATQGAWSSCAMRARIGGGDDAE